MTNRSNIVALAEAIEALANCERTPRNEWGATLHKATVARVMASAPHGSGIDDTVTLDERSNRNRIMFHVPYHNMNADGFYCGWSAFRVIIRPTYGCGIDH